ncbi:MAG: OB-fold domain-containing protein [Burkholderiaceae bacterium]|nr:OB-fold domain-containing protein [Burkholderiaceae bacterium]
METRMPTSPLAAWREHLNAGRLAFQRDTATGKAVFYPRVAAPGSGNTALVWEVSKGLGTVYATTAVAQRNEAAYNVALIDMDEGFRLMSRVESIAAEDVKIGQRVKVRIHQPGGDEAPYPVFDILGAA